jgi:hypothetical protein
MQVQGVNTAVQVPESHGFKLWDGDLPSFSDIVDAINPLQHIPIVSNLYQNATGDEMGAVANVGVATLFGGLIGGAVALANEVVEAITGDSVTGHLLSSVMTNDNVDIATATTELEPASGGTQQQPTKIATTTKDWIYGDFGTNIVA